MVWVSTATRTSRPSSDDLMRHRQHFPSSVVFSDPCHTLHPLHIACRTALAHMSRNFFKKNVNLSMAGIPALTFLEGAFDAGGC